MGVYSHGHRCSTYMYYAHPHTLSIIHMYVHTHTHTHTYPYTQTSPMHTTTLLSSTHLIRKWTQMILSDWGPRPPDTTVAWV